VSWAGVNKLEGFGGGGGVYRQPETQSFLDNSANDQHPKQNKAIQLQSKTLNEISPSLNPCDDTRLLFLLRETDQKENRISWPISATVQLL